MNKIFKVIWSKSKQCYIVVSEMAKNHSGKKKIVVASILAAMAVGSDMSVSVQAGGLDGGQTKPGVYYATSIGSGANVGSQGSLAIGNDSYAEGTAAPGAGVDPSIAIGKKAKAVGNSSLAIGMNSKIEYSYGVAVGRNTEVSGDYGVGIGYNSRSAIHGIAMGEQARALKEGATTLGVSSRGYGKGAIAIGWQSLAGADVYTVGVPGNDINSDSTSKINDYNKWGDMSVGLRAMATGGNATALGRNAAAIATNAVAIGGGNGDSFNDNTERTVASGEKAAAIGYNSSASGISASALGTKASASAENAAAIGTSASASAKDTLAAGTSASATAEGATAVGKAAKAQKANATAVGSGAVASEANATAIGNGAQAKKGDALALGTGATASEVNATAIGNGATAEKSQAIAIGKGAEASEVSSTAIGEGANAEKANSLAIGKTAISGGENGIAVGNDAQAQAKNALAVGTSTRAQAENDSVFGHASTASGGGSTAIGYLVNTSGNQAFGAGSNTTVSKAAAVGIGYKVTASGDRAISIGNNNGNTNTEATQEKAIAIGSGARAKGTSSIAMGTNINVEKNNTTAIGMNLTANESAEGSTLIGNNSTTKGNQSVSIGVNNETEKAAQYSTAVGYDVRAKGKNAIAIGSSDGDTNKKVIAASESSIAIGTKAQSNNVAATAIGKEALAGNTDAIAIGTSAEGNATSTTAIGKGAKAKKNSAIALGTGATAEESTTIAIGNSSKASKENDNAFGNGSTASGGGSTAIGYLVNTSGNQAFGAGSNTTVSEAAAVGIGYQVTASGNRSIGIGADYQGRKTTASASYTVALGAGTQASATSAVAIGTNASAGLEHSVALGEGSTTTANDGTASTGYLTNESVSNSGNGVIAIGNKRNDKNDTGTILRRIVGLASGTNDYDAANIKQLKALESNERHIKAQKGTAAYKPDATGKITLNYVNGKGEAVTGETAEITDVAKKSDEWILRTQDGTTTGDATPQTVTGVTKKAVTLKAGDNIAIENSNGTVTIKAKNVVTSISSGNNTALTVNPSNGAVTITPNIASSVGATGEDGKLVTSGIVKNALDNKIDKTAEMHIKTGEYTVGTDGNASLIQQNGNNQDQSARVVIKDIARKSVVDGINTTVNTHTSQIANLTTTVGGKVSQTEFDTFKVKAITFTGDDNAGVARTLDTTLTVKGGANYSPTTTTNTNIRVEKDGSSGANGLLVKLSDKLSGMKEIAGDGKNDLVIKNGDTKVTVKAPKDGNTGSIDFGDTKLVASNLDASIKYRANDDTAANAKSVKLADGFNYVASNDATTTAEGPKSGLAITAEDNGKVTFGLDKATREKVDNAADKNLSNLSDDGKNKVKELAKTAAQDAVKVADGINTTVGTTTTAGVTTYKVNANDTTVAVTGDGLAITGGDLGTDKVRKYSLDLSDATKGKLTAVGGLATVIGGTSITNNGTVTGPTFNITKSDGTSENATTLKDAIDKLNKTNEGQNTKITNLTNTVTNNYNDLSTKITNAGTAATTAATTKGLNFTGDDTTDTGKVHRDLGETLTIKGGENFTRGAGEKNIKVVKNSNDLDVKLAENLGNIKEIAGDGKTDLVIKNGDTKVTVKAPKDGNTGSIDFGDTKLVASNLDASIKYRANDDTAANAKSVKLADGFNYVASNDATTTAEGPKSGLAITAEDNGKVTFGLDKATREKVDNAADKNLSNLSDDGKNKVKELAKTAAQDAVKVADGINTTVGTTTTAGVTTYKVNANDTTVAVTGDGLAITGGDLGTDKVRKYSLDLSDATKGKLTAVGGLATVIGGTSITNNGTVTGPTFNITKSDGTSENATTLKDAIDKLNKTNEGQNTKITNLTNTVTNNYNDLSTKITNAGTAATTAATTKGLNFTGDDTTDNGKIHRDLGETLTIKGGANFTREANENNIKVVKNSNDLDVKLAENLGNIKEIAGDGKTDLVIKNGDTKVTVKAPKDGNKGSIDFGDTKLVASNLDASIKYRANDDTAANAKSVKLADGFNYVASNDATTTAEGPKSGLAITAENNGKVTFGLDKATRTILDNAASKTYVNDAITNLNSAVTGNARLNFAGNATKDAQDADVEKVSLALATGTLHIKGDATDITTTAKNDTVTIGLTDTTKNKLKAIGNLATVIGGTTINTDGTVTGPTFNITKSDGTSENATTLKDAIDKLNKTNEGQNATISNLTNTVTNNYNDLSTKITNAGTATTNALTEKGLDFYGNKDTEATDKVHRNLGEALKVKGAENFTRAEGAKNNIDVVKNTAGDGFDVKLAGNLGNIKEIAGDGKTDLVIKNGDTKIVVSPGKEKEGDTPAVPGSVNFGDTTLVAKNLDASIKYRANDDTAANAKSVKLADGFNYVASNDATTTAEGPKSGLAITAENNGKVTFGLDKATREKVDNAADKNLSNLSDDGKNKITNLAKAAAKEVVKVAPGINTTVDTDVTTTEGVTTYKVNANDTKVAIAGDGLSISGGDLGAADRIRTYTLDLSDATKGKLTAVGGLATVIGGTTIAENGTVTGPTFNITKSDGTSENATTLKDAIDKLNKTNEGQNATISNLTNTVTNNYNDLSTKITNAGTATTNALTEKGLDFYGNKDTEATDKVHRNLGEALKVKGAENFTRAEGAKNNIDVVKNTAGDGFDVKLAENLGNIKEIAGDGKTDLVIKNGDTKVTVKAPKGGNTGSIDFGDTKLVTNNLDANISYKAGTETDKKTVKLQDGFNFVAGTGTVAPKNLAAGTASPTATTDSVEPKKGIAISTAANGVVNIGLDSDTRSIIDNAASKDYVATELANLNTTITGNANLNFAGNVTKDAQDADVAKVGLALATGTLHIKGDATDITTTAKNDTVTIGLTDTTKNKLKAIGNLATVIGGTTINTDGTVTGPTFNITKSDGTSENATTLKDAIDKLNKTNEGQNATISNLTNTVTNNYNDLSTKITNAGTATTNALTEKGLDFYGNKDTEATDKVHRNLGEALKVKGAENFTRAEGTKNNIDVVKNTAGDGFDVKLAENLGNIKEIAGDGTNDLVIKNGDTKVTVKAPKDGNTGSIDFGDTKLVTNNLDANISYKAGTETDKKTVKLQDGFNFVAGTGTVAPKHLEAGTASPTEATDSVEPKKGIAISTAANGVVNIGLDSDTRGAIDNAASKDYVATELANLNTTITGNANLNFAGNVTKDAQDADVEKVGLALAKGTLHIKGDATDITTTAKGDTVTIGLTPVAQGKLAAVGNLANVIGGTTIATDGTVTGPTFNITNAAGGTDTATTLKDAIDKLNATNEGQNTAITKLGDTVTKNYNTLSDKIDKAGETTTNALTEKGLDFYGNKDATETDKVHRNLGQALKVKGAENFTREATATNNIDVVKNTAGDGFDVKLAENLGNIKEIAGDGTHDLVIKNGDTKVTVKAPKDGNTGSIDFGDTKLVASNLDASIKYRANDDAVANAKSVKLADGFNYVASNDGTTTTEGPKSGLAITAEDNGKVTFGLDKATRTTLDNAADKNLSNLSEAGNNKITNLAKVAAKETVKVAPGINTTVDTDTTTTEGVTTYKVNANDTKVAIAGDGLSISGGDLGATNRVRTYTLDLSDTTKGKLTAVGGLATVIGGTTIADNGTVTGPTFNITKADGTNEIASTIKEAIEKLNTTNAGQNTTISNLTKTVNDNYNDLSSKITNAGAAATNALTEKGLDFYGNRDTADADKVHRNLGQALKVKGAENFTREATATNNIDVVKNTSGDGFDVKLAENLGNIKEISGDGTHDLVIKNGDTKVTVKAPKDGNKGSIDFGDTKLVTNNLEADMTYRANSAPDTEAKSVKLQKGLNFVASDVTTTTEDGPKSGLAITAEDDGKVTFGLDKATREKVDNAADKNLSNLSEVGSNKVTELAKAAAKEVVKVAPGINTTVDTDTTTTAGVTTYKVNANDTKVAIAGDGLAISGGDLGATDRVRTYTLDLSDATKGKLTAVGNLSNVIGGTTIATDGTVTGPTFNITNATGGTDTATTLKDAIDKLNATNEGQNTAITKLGDTVTKNYNTLSDKIDKAGETATNALTAKGLDFYGNKDAAETDKVHRDLGQALKVQGAENFTRAEGAKNNIDVVKNTIGDGFDVKLAENLGNIKEISGDGTHDLVIKNGDTKVTVKAPKDGNTGSIDFGDTKLVTNNLDANISYKAGTETDKKTVKLQDGFNFVAGTGTVAPKHLEAGTASPTEATDSVEPKKGIAISTAANGVVNIGLDSDTRGAIDNAADKNLSNLSDDGNNKITNLAKAAAKEVVKVAPGINTTVDTDVTTTEGVTTYKVNANDTKVAIAGDGLSLSGGDLGATDRVRTYTLDLSDATKGKLTAVGGLATVIGGTTITENGTVTGPTFNITKAEGGTDPVNTLKDAVEKLDATNKGQNEKITNLGNSITEKGLDFYGNKDTESTDKVHRNLGEALKVKGAENFTRVEGAKNNIDVVKNTAGDGFDVKLAENLGNIKEIAGDGTNDLVIKNGDTKVTVKAPKDGNKGSIDFGDTKLVTNNLEADMTYRANSAPDTEAKSVKLQKGLNFVAGTGTVAPKNLAAGTASPTATTDEVTPKKGIVISTEADGVVNIGLDNDTRSAIDNAANQDLSNLTTAGKKVITDAAQGSVKVAAGKNITVDPETKDNVTTYTVNANDTLVTSDNTLVTVNGGTLGEDKVRTYTLGLSTAVTDKLAQLSAKNADGRDGKLGSETDAIASAGIAKADGLNGETATYKVNALRHGEAGSVVYTDANGNRIVKATDGNYYKATEVNANGVVKTSAENNGIAPEAVDKATIVATLVNANGTTAPAADDANKVATTKLTNIKEAAITATSNDAVTGRQLHGLKSDLATALGGGSTVDANGSFTGPTYNITKDDGTNTSDPVNNVGDAITKLDTRINNTNTTLSTKGLDFYGNKDTADTDKVHRNLGEALKVKGAENFTRTGTNNIDVVKNTVGDGFDVKLAENLGNIKEIAGDGKTDLVIKNGDATITVKPGKAGSTDPDTGTVTPPTNPSVDFGNTTLVVKNIEADITYRANSAEDADAHTVKLKKGLNFVAGTGTVAPKNLEAGTASPTATTDSVVTKKGIAISTDVDGVVNIGLDNDTRSAIDNAANQDLSNLTTAGKKVITDAAQGAVKVAAGNNVTVDTETKDNVTKYTVNGRDTTVKAAENGSVSVTGGTLNAKGEREYTVDLTDATKAQINRIDGIDTRLTTAEGNITTLQGDMTQAKQDITVLQGDMTKAKADIVTNAGNIATNAGNIATNKANITKNAGDIATNTANITKNAGNITINATNIGKNAEAIQALQGNSAKKDLSNLTNAGKDVVTGLVNVVGTNGITVTNATDDTSRVKTFTAKLDEKVTFGKDGNKITIDGTTGTMTAPNATINVVNTNTVQVGDINKTNTAVTSEGVTVTTKQPDGTVTSTVIIKDGTVSGLTNTKWDPAKVTDTDRSKAATQGQMKDVSDTLQKGRVFAADTGVASTTVALGDTLTIRGGATGRLTDNNIGVELTAATAKEPATMTVRLAKDVKMKDGSTSYNYYLPEVITKADGTKDIAKNADGTVKYKTDKAGNPITLVTTTVNGEGITIAPVKELNKPSVTLTADGLDNGGNAIHNVGPGTAPSDAATVGQVSAAAGALQNKVHTVGAHAAALAAMNPLSYDPLKKSQVMAGYGAYKGNNAVAIGVAHYANEDTLFNVGVSVGNGENMVNAGMTYRFGGEDSMIPERYKGGPISSVYVMQDEITALKAENARKDIENAKKEAENEEMKAQIKMLIERVTMLEAKK